MSSKYNFLFNFFLVSVIFSFYGIVDCMATGAVITNTQKQAIIAAAQFSTATDSSAQTNTVQICPQGQYVYKCGDYRVGLNWLKSATFPGPNGDNDSVNTKDYYVGTTTTELMRQFKTFFNGTNESILARSEDDNIVNIVPSSYIRDRETIFNYLCHPVTSTVTCVACPNGATVKESKVQLDSSNLTIQNSWEFYTLVDCYMEEFEDSTGSYYYENEQAEKAKCYYTTTDAISTFSGDEIGTFVPGLNANYSIFEVVE